MAKELSYQPLTNLGVNGLNTQHNPATLDTTWLTVADNIVLRESGRISFRKGLKQKVVPSDTAIASITEHNDQGTNKIFASYGTSIYTVDLEHLMQLFLLVVLMLNIQLWVLQELGSL